MADSIRDISGLSTRMPIETGAEAVPARGGASAGKQDASDTAPIKDVAHLSSLGNLLGTTVGAAASSNSSRSELVAALKSQIAAGAYQPNMAAVAARVAIALKGIK